MQDFSGAYVSPFLDTVELKIISRAQKVSDAFKKWAPQALDSAVNRIH